MYQLKEETNFVYASILKQHSAEQVKILQIVLKVK